jgi:hypothetical protein
LARLTTDIAARLGTWAATSVVETRLAGITANVAAAIVGATFTVPAARLAGVVTAGAVLTGVTRGATHTGASRRVAAQTLTRIARSREANRAAGSRSRATGSADTHLACGAADPITDLIARTARSAHTSLSGITADAVATVMRATICAGTTVVPRREARSAHSVVANLTGRAAVCARVTRAEAFAVSHTTNRRRARTATIATLVAKPFVLGGITGAFAGR